MPSELTKALARVDQAKSIYSQSRVRLASLRQNEEDAEIPSDLPPEAIASYAVEKSFGAMVRDGFAYSLPLLIVAISILIVYLLLRH
jgi:hypothetical protein